jgi:energy-coupling factor transporter ATP-binding protein EcfA2
MASWLKVEIENLGPFSGKVELEIDTPLTIVTGETGTGKSFLLRLLSVLLKNMRSTPDARALEGDLTSEFGHPKFAVHEEAEEGRVSLSYGDEKLADVKVYSKPLATHGMHSDFIEIEEWKGSQLYIELAERSVIAPDVRVPLIRYLLSVDQSSSSPSASAFTTMFSYMLSEEHWLLEEMLIPMVEEGLLPRTRSYFKGGVVAGYQARNVSSAAISLLSLAPVVLRLHEGRALLAAVDTVELHLTPLLQAAAAVNLARWAKKGWLECEEHPAPLLLVTHSSIVLSALLAEVEEGVKDKLVRLPDRYRLTEDDVKTVIFYREGGVVKCDVGKGIIPPRYLREYARFL